MALALKLGEVAGCAQSEIEMRHGSENTAVLHLFFITLVEIWTWRFLQLSEANSIRHMEEVEIHMPPKPLG